MDEGIINEAKKLDIECIVEENSPISQNIEIIGNIYSKPTNKLNWILVTGPEDIYPDEIEEFYSLQDKNKNFNFKNVTLLFKDEKEIQSKLKGFNKNKDILFFLMPTSFSNSKKYISSSTNFSSMNQIIKAIKDSTDAPIFTTSRSGVEIGMIGGYTVDLYKQGEITGNIINKFFNGEKNIPKEVKGEATNSLVFNYKQMIKYGISRGSISDDVELVSKPDSILSKYKNIIILSVIIFIITIHIYNHTLYFLL